MNCNAARRTLGAEPHTTHPELEEHLGTCPACAQYGREMRRLEENILRALALEPAALRSDGPPRAHMRIVPTGPRRAGSRTVLAGARRWALAASVLLVATAAIVLWSAAPRSSLAADVVAHVVREPRGLSTSTRVSREKLAVVLRRAGLQLDPLDGEITFAQTCWFHGRWVPHFAVRTARGLATVLILPDEHVVSAERFTEGRFSGVLLPAPRGSVAVLAQDGLDPQQPARQVMRALHPQPRD